MIARVTTQPFQLHITLVAELSSGSITPSAVTHCGPAVRQPKDENPAVHYLCGLDVDQRPSDHQRAEGAEVSYTVASLCQELSWKQYAEVDGPGARSFKGVWRD
jgi:hypothetical protein